jgi:Leucine-rich repeat (LRR) protein
LSKLPSLTLSNQPIESIVICNLPELQNLQLNNNQISALNLSNLDKLETLNLANNKITSVKTLSKIAPFEILAIG